MSRSNRRPRNFANWTGSASSSVVPARQSEAYRQAISDRKARKLAKQRAEVEIVNMHFTSEGDFSHLAAQPMRIRR